MTGIAWLLESFSSGWITTILARLLLTALLTGAIGYERESVNQPAGFRTHTLVGIGACLVALTAAYLAASSTAPTQSEVARMSAAVVSGVGFLGAGTIMREGTSIRGLTTAASVWAVACIGLAVGVGFISGAIAATIITIITLVFLLRFEPVQRDEEACRRNGSRRRRTVSPSDLPGPGAGTGRPAAEPDCLGVALDRESQDILGIVQLLDSHDLAVQAVRVLDSGDAADRSVHVCLETGPAEPAVRAAVIDELLRDRRVLRILPDSAIHPPHGGSSGSGPAGNDPKGTGSAGN